MSQYPFGNDPAKIDGYKKFWRREDCSRSLIGFSIKSWFPLEEFKASREWQKTRYLQPHMINPQEFMDEQVQYLREGEQMDDDILRGASPLQSVPWLCGMLGGQLRILPGNVLAEEQALPWEKLKNVQLDRQNPWFKKYVDFIDTLVETADGRFPVTHGTLSGPTDLAGMYRGHTQNLYDLIEEPEESMALLWDMTNAFKEITEVVWERAPLFHDGYFDAQYQLWTPGPTIRMQEDAIAVYSPDLYRKFVQPLDQFLAKNFSACFMHLHATSMHALDDLLDIDGLNCFQVNYEVTSGGPPIEGMIPYFRKMQDANRSILVRGSFTPDELSLLIDSLDPRGLYIYIMVQDMKEVEILRTVIGM